MKAFQKCSSVAIHRSSHSIPGCGVPQKIQHGSLRNSCSCNYGKSKWYNCRNFGTPANVVSSDKAHLSSHGFMSMDQDGFSAQLDIKQKQVRCSHKLARTDIVSYVASRASYAHTARSMYSMYCSHAAEEGAPKTSWLPSHWGFLATCKRLAHERACLEKKPRHAEINLANQNQDLRLFRLRACAVLTGCVPVVQLRMGEKPNLGNLPWRRRALGAMSEYPEYEQIEL